MLNQVILVGRVSHVDIDHFDLEIDGEEYTCEYENLGEYENLKIGQLLGVKGKLSKNGRYIRLQVLKVTPIEESEE